MIQIINRLPELKIYQQIAETSGSNLFFIKDSTLRELNEGQMNFLLVLKTEMAKDEEEHRKKNEEKAKDQRNDIVVEIDND